MRFFAVIIASLLCASCATAAVPTKGSTSEADEPVPFIRAPAAAPVTNKPVAKPVAPAAAPASKPAAPATPTNKPAVAPAVKPAVPVAQAAKPATPATQAGKPATPATQAGKPATPATQAGKPKAASTNVEEQLTVISSDKLTFDYKKKYAYFEGSVVVTDPQLKLLADKMTVNFDDGNKVKKIVAEGNVIMITEDKKSKSDTATYDVVSGEIVLEGTPSVTRGKDVLSGKRITFWRDSDRMKVEGGSTLFLHKDGQGTQGIFDGPGAK